MKNYYLKTVIIIFIYVLAANTLQAQNVAITDDVSYVADSSAMLDVKSTNKGMLVPRVSTIERLAIYKPANGLLVYDTDFDSFFYYNGITWLSLTMGSTGISGQALFAVTNLSGDTVFAVYDDGVKVVIPEGGRKGRIGGFAVSGRVPGKGIEEEYLRVTPDSTRIYVNDTVSSKGRIGGFAVSGRVPGKASTVTNDYLVVTNDSTRIYINDSYTGKGRIGGFAVSGRVPGKTITSNYLEINKDSTRVYVNESGKGRIGGFAVSGRVPGKGNANQFLNLTSKNYFIGYESGYSLTSGLYNSFLGYQTGKNTTTGDNNVFIGFQSGYSNDTAIENTFIGHFAGLFNESGNYNTFIGSGSGQASDGGNRNAFYGYRSGFGNSTGSNNVFLGYNAGYNNKTGESNVFIGNNAGYTPQGSANNVFIGYYAGGSSNSLNNNTFIGTLAGQNSAGENNVFLGYRAGSGTGASSNNIGLGYNSMENISQGDYNVALGAESGRNVLNGSKNVFIGYQSGSSEQGDEKLYIENSNANQDGALLYGDFANDLLTFNADVGINTTNPFAPMHINSSRDAALTTANSGVLMIGNPESTNLLFDNNEIMARNATTSSTLHLNNEGGDVHIGGYLGLGTSSPKSILHVNGRVTIGNPFELMANMYYPGDAFLNDGYAGRIEFMQTDGKWRFQNTAVSGLADEATELQTRMSISPDGFVGIATSSPSTYLHVNSSNDATLEDGSGVLLIGSEGGENMLFDVNEIMARNAGVAADLYLNYHGGTVYVGEEIVQTSDFRLKSNISLLSYGLDEILKLKPVFFSWLNRNNKDRQLGFIAQELEPVIQELVHTSDKDGIKSVNYTGLIPVLVNAIKEQDEKINAQQNKLIEQESKIEYLIKEIEKLKSQIK